VTASSPEPVVAEESDCSAGQDCPDYFGRWNPSLLSVMPADAAVVLEIGCGTGALAGQYRRINPGCVYVGIERNAAAAAKARAAGQLDRVLVADVETITAADLPELSDGADCLVYGDVLEHLVDPWAVLARQRAWLKPDGQVAACLPNVQHWELLRDLLRGRWEYVDEGILDRTHLRFFTLESALAMFQAAGLTVFEVRPLLFPSAAGSEFLERLEPLVRDDGIDPELFKTLALARQFVIRAALAAPPPIRVRVRCPEPCTRSTEARLLAPARLLATLPGVRVLETLDVQLTSRSTIAEATVCVDGDIPGEDAAALLDRRRQLLREGALVVALCDVDPRSDPATLSKRLLSLRCCHAVQTVSEALAAFLRRINPEVAVFPERLAELPDLVCLEQGRTETATDAPVRVCCAAPDGADWTQLFPALDALGMARGDSLEWCVLAEERLFGMMHAPIKRLILTSQNAERYAVLRSSQVVLVPPTRSVSGTSGLAWEVLFIAAHGAAVLAPEGAAPEPDSRSLPAFPLATYATGEQCAARLAYLLDNADERQAQARSAADWVRAHGLLGPGIRARYIWYRRLLTELPRLNRELRRRAPELGGRVAGQAAKTSRDQGHGTS